jgi:tRNA A-37 threonylcarbamoyl transferase component Bud32
MSSTHKIVTVCTACKAHLRVGAEHISDHIRCPKCNCVFEVQAIKFGPESDALASRDALNTQADVTAPVQQASAKAARSVEPIRDLNLAEDSEPAGPPTTGLSESGRSAGQPTSIGRYIVEQELGRGAFGVVYSANDPVLQRRVAIKLQTRQLDDLSFEKMLREARAAARLRHPNIVAVFEVATDQHRPFVVSELIDGQSLADRIATSPIEPKVAATLIRDIARGLAYAHGEGLIHRDVKPQNIMIDSEERPQLTDFGLAVDRNDEQQRESAAYSRSGTLAYMAPEQAGIGAASVGPAVDQYALAATLFELLCGQRPHSGGSLEIIAGLEKPEPPHLRTVLPAVPFDLDAICFKAMSHEPWHRYQDCNAFADDLDRFLKGELIKGRKIGLLERAGHYSKKHPRIAAWTTGGVIAATGLLLTTSAIIVRMIYLAQEQAATLQSELTNTNTNILQSAGIRDVQDGSALADLPLWIAYSRKLNSAARADSMGDKQLFGKLLDESREQFRDWEYRHLEARRRQGLISSFTIDDPNVSRIMAGSDNASCIIQFASTPVIKHKHYAIRDGAQLSEWSVKEQTSTLVMAHHSPTAYYAVPKTNFVKDWNWKDKQESVEISLPFPANQLLISNDDKWLYAKLPAQQFAIVNLESKQVLFDSKLKHFGLPVFSPDSSFLGISVGQQLQKLQLTQPLQHLPVGIPPISGNISQLLASLAIDGMNSLYHAEWIGGAWSLRKDGVEIAQLGFQPQTLRRNEANGELVLLSINSSLLQVAILKPGTSIMSNHTLLTGPPWISADIGMDGRLVYAVANQTVYVWDTQLLTPQSESENLGVVRSLALDGKSAQSIVLQTGKVSAVNIETGKVLWSREHDQ